MGPLYTWVAACPDGSFRRIQAMFRVLLAWISLHIKGRRMSCCPMLWPKLRGELFRLYAKAEGNLVVLRGWSLEFGKDPLQALWFSLQLTQEDVPYLFEREPCRAVATLELFAAVVGLMVLVPWKTTDQGPVGDP